MTFQPPHFTVWTEIPVTDLDRSIAFYDAVLQTSLTKEQMGPDLTAVFRTSDHPNGVAGHLYTGKPASDGAGPTVHLASPGRLEDTMERVSSAGGSVVSEPIALPDGRFFYATDIDGNSIGFFEASSAAAA